MSMTVKDVINWLQTLPADDAVYIDKGGPENIYHLFSEKDDEAYLEVGGQHLEDEDEEDSMIFEEDDDEDEDDEDDEDWEDEEDEDEDLVEEDWN